MRKKFRAVTGSTAPGGAENSTTISRGVAALAVPKLAGKSGVPTDGVFALVVGKFPAATGAGAAA
jgi:hypothetical protein